MAIDPYLLLLLVACLYVLVFGGFGFARREGVSIQLVVEVIAVTAILACGGWLLGIEVNPFLFLAILYLVTLRSRLIIEAANILARRGSYRAAFRLYDLAQSVRPDAASRLIVLANRGAAELYSGQIEVAIETLTRALRHDRGPGLGIKYEAATHYNLGYAYEKAGNGARAVAEYNAAIDLFPGSPYAQAAEAALRRRRKHALQE